MKFVVTLIGAALLTCAAVPAVHAAPGLETYGRLPRIQGPSISSDGTRLAYVGELHGETALVVQEFDGKLLVDQPLGGLAVTGLVWAGDDIVLVKINHPLDVQQKDGSWLTQTMVDYISINVKTGKNFKLGNTKTSAPNLNEYYGVRNIDGHWCALFGGTDFGLKDVRVLFGGQLLKVDLETGESTRISDQRVMGAAWVVDEAGQVLAFSTFDSVAARVSIRSSKGDTIFSQKDKFARVETRGLGRESGTIFVGPPGFGDEGFFELSAKGGKPQPLATPAELQEIWFDPQSHHLIGFTSGIRDPKVQLFDPALQAKVNAVLNAFPGQHPDVVGASQGFSKMIVTTVGNDDPGTYWLVDLNTRRASELGRVYPIEPQDIGQFRYFDYAAADGLKLDGILTLPPHSDGKNLPLVVMAHGGPRGRDKLAFNWWAQAFASRGYAVFQPNFRGSEGYGKKLEEAGFGEIGGKMQTDISDGVAALAAQGVIDPKRVCIVGTDYGGYAALTGVTSQHGVYRCAVGFDAITDLSRRFSSSARDTPSGDERIWLSYAGAKSTRDPVIAARSPITHAAQADAPIRLIYGKGEKRAAESEAMATALRAAAKTVDVVPLEGGDSLLRREIGRQEFIKASVEFVEKYNPPN